MGNFQKPRQDIVLLALIHYRPSDGQFSVGQHDCFYGQASCMFFTGLTFLTYCARIRHKAAACDE
jgi:hypothetical protein